MGRRDELWNLRNGTYIETTRPTGYDVLINGTSKYLNFNSISGASGYGFRDNGGTMEWKNNGGSWAAFGSGGGTPATPFTSIQFNDSGTFGGDSNLEWDNTHKQLRVGLTGAPFDADSRVGIEMVKSANDYVAIAAQNQSSGDSATTDLFVSADNDNSTLIGHYQDMGITSSTYNPIAAGNIRTVSVNASGTGYAVGNVLTISTGGDGNATVTVATINGSGGVTSVTITNNGTGYVTGTGYLTTGGAGTGCKINVLGIIDYTLWGANDGYVFTSGGNLVISTDTSGKVIKFSTGGVGTINERARITDTTFQVGRAGTFSGNVSFLGLTSGTAILTAPAVAGTPTLTLPIITGTLELQPTIVTGISAAGSNQAGATALSGYFSHQEISTVAASTGVRLPTPTTTSRIKIFNRGLNVLSVYPASGHTINSALANIPFTLGPKSSMEFVGKSTTNWYTFPSFINPVGNVQQSNISDALFLGNVYSGGTYGDGSNIPVITFDPNGLVTGITTTPVTGASANTFLNYLSTQFDDTFATILPITGLDAIVVDRDERYEFSSWLWVTLDATGGFQVAINGSLTIDNIIYQVEFWDDATSLPVYFSRQTSLGGAATYTGGATSGWIRISGSVDPRSDGSLYPEFGQATSNGTSSVLVGSTFRVIKSDN